MLQVAIVGLAHIHTPGFIDKIKKREDVKVKCVWDPDGERAQKSATALGVPAVPDVKAIWADPEINAAIICSETNRHKPLVLACAKAKKHMFVEKPLGLAQWIRTPCRGG